MDQEREQTGQGTGTDKYGIDDLPIKDIGEDGLGMEKYILGIQDFICACPTPMSIALQGDWGTGKTSFIKIMRENLGGNEGKDRIKTIYFNTWQYSQFDMSGDLYSSFLLGIMENLRRTGDITESDIKEFLKSVAFVSLSAVTDCIPSKIGDSVRLLLKHSERYFEAEQERSKRVSELKQKFANLVKKTVQDGRLVIFVDDLDRLSPETAVELLEIIKLFMDVKGCVFVLAIDYDVVVRGVKKKFGNDMDDGKCRSFFDKIIQLPFHMPVKNYQIEKMIEDKVGNAVKGYEEILGAFIRATAGANPRTFKRAFNSFCLLSLIGGHDGNTQKFGTMDNAFLLMIPFIQMASSEAYNKLFEDASAWKDSEAGSEEEGIKKEEKHADAVLRSFDAAVRKIIDNSEETVNEDDIEDRLSKIIHLADITSVRDDASASRGKAVKVDRIMIADKEEAVGNATDAIVRTYKQLLSCTDAGKIEDFMRAHGTILTTKAKKNNSAFRNKKPLGIGSSEGELYLGCSTGFSAKARQVNALCKFLGVEDGYVQWFDGEEEVYRYTK